MTCYLSPSLKRFCCSTRTEESTRRYPSKRNPRASLSPISPHLKRTRVHACSRNVQRNASKCIASDHNLVPAFRPNDKRSSRTQRASFSSSMGTCPYFVTRGSEFCFRQSSQILSSFPILGRADRRKDVRTPYLPSNVVLNGHLSILRQRQVRDLLQEVSLIGGQHQDPLALLARARGTPQPVNVLGPVGWNAYLEDSRLVLAPGHENIPLKGRMY
jgi:hypothetical protein